METAVRRRLHFFGDVAVFFFPALSPVSARLSDGLLIARGDGPRYTPTHFTYELAQAVSAPP